MAKAFWDLPENVRLALLLHEMGHLYAGPRGGEDAANKQIKERSGIKISYKDQPHGKNLEWISPRDKTKAKEFLGMSDSEENAA